MRLTKKSGYFNENPIYSIITEQNEMFVELNKCVQKLGQLEDIEDELGIDLIVLFKAFKNGIYIKDQNGVHYHKQPSNTLEENIAYFRRLFEKENIENYGKTWALTKEELQ